MRHLLKERAMCEISSSSRVCPGQLQIDTMDTTGLAQQLPSCGGLVLTKNPCKSGLARQEESATVSEGGGGGDGA